jgi:hypothetical protein
MDVALRERLFGLGQEGSFAVREPFEEVEHAAV